MAIPITCPGCKAGFEVPDNLAGKTIRCTSCKTQLSVPAVAEVAEVAEAVADGSGEKKPIVL
ncbi:MAG: zinc-ribbon domain-containing protein [Gemmataceae bacterium]|nr:zinc-ribbon domain-containing protein [Gemmataceae bacterium]